MTIDTEAALLVSRQSLSRVVGSTDPAALDELRKRIRVTAVPNTEVLILEVRADERRPASQEEAESVAESYLLTRRAYLSNRRDQALLMLREELAELAGPGGEQTPPAPPASGWSGPSTRSSSRRRRPVR